MIYIYVYSNFYFGSNAAFPIKAYRFIFFIVAYMIRQNFKITKIHFNDTCVSLLEIIFLRERKRVKKRHPDKAEGGWNVWIMRNVSIRSLIDVSPAPCSRLLYLPF